MEKYFVQTLDEKGNLHLSVNTQEEIIRMVGYEDCSGCEHAIFKCIAFEEITPLRHQLGERPNIHIFIDETTGDVEFMGESPEH